MQIKNPLVFKEYDIRGIVEQDFSEPLINAVGQSFGTFVIRETGKKNPLIAVGRDVRLSGPCLLDWLAKGLCAAGVQVLDLGPCPTPTTYFSLFHLPIDGAVMITGSHNPKEYNGFKLCFNKTTLFGSKIQDIRTRIEKDDFEKGNGHMVLRPAFRALEPWVPNDFAGLLEKKVGILDAYIAHLVKRHQKITSRKPPLRIVVDAGNGTAGLVMPAILKKLGCDLVELFCEIDGNFPNHHPDPTIPENLIPLIRKVKDVKADIGLAFDGDADRLGVVDESGRILWGDEIMVLLARDILKRHPGATVIGEVKCSQRMYDAIEKAGGNPIMWKTGHSLIKNKMKEEHALLAGEMSGHIFLAEDYYGYDDAVHSGLEVCRLLVDHLSAGGHGLSELLKDLPETVTTPEIRTDCPDTAKFRIVEDVKKVLENHVESGKSPIIKKLITIDGVRAVFDHGWGLVRASNTQPILVSRFEATEPVLLDSYQQFMQKIIAKAIKTVG